MKITIFSALFATLLVASSCVEAHMESGSSNAVMRRHHVKQAQALQKRAFSGKATWYGVSDGDLGACGGALNPGDFFVALNQGQYGNLNSKSSYCGKTITISNGVKTAKAKILDACPMGEQCHWGALDMSRALFSYFNDFGVGVFDITWWIDGDDSSSSGASASASSSKSSNNNDDNSSSSNDDTADAKAAANRAAKKKADAKEAAAEKKKKEEEKKKKQEAEKKKEEEKKKKEAAKKKKEAAKKKKEAAKKAAAEKVRNAQKQNIAAFGQIMQTLNQMVESAVDGNTASNSSA